MRHQNEAEDEERGQKVEEDGPLKDVINVSIYIIYVLINIIK